jgi:hypothetical protein
MSELTGRRRYRKHFDGLLLQVEFSHWTVDGWRCAWRDAVIADVMPVEMAAS